MSVLLFAKIFISMVIGGALWMWSFAQFGSPYHHRLNCCDYVAVCGMLVMIAGGLGCICACVAMIFI